MNNYRSYRCFRYEMYYKRINNLESTPRFYSNRRYGEYYKKVNGLEAQQKEGEVKQVRNIKGKVRKAQRYGTYYEDYMQPVYEEIWKKTIKRIKTLKKEIKALGNIPNKESQLIKTVNYFLKLVNLTSNFESITFMPESKIDAVDELLENIELISGKNGNASYINKAKPGELVDINNLWIGTFTQIGVEKLSPKTEIRNIDGKAYKVEVDYIPISKWLKGKVISRDGYHVTLSQSKMASICSKLMKELIKSINKVLE